jgi:hypothetical protein
MLHPLVVTVKKHRFIVHLAGLFPNYEQDTHNHNTDLVAQNVTRGSDLFLSVLLLLCVAAKVSGRLSGREVVGPEWLI